MHIYDQLVPDVVLTAVEAQGFRPTGALFPLNSYENRVYEIALESDAPVIAKFYRPGRWTAETIDEEHRFVWAAQALEIPVVAPLRLATPIPQGEYLGLHAGFYFALYPKFRGREQAEHDAERLRQLGRTLARLHNLGESFPVRHRLALTPQTYGHASIPVILALPFVPDTQRAALAALLPQVVALTEGAFASGEGACFLVHGDCHLGNVLWNVDGPHLLDFDDMVVAPPVQDLWMLLNGSAADQHAQREALFEGYTTFRPFDMRALRLAEPLRTLRLIRHAAWLATRHDEPAFQRAFPYFTQARYWETFAQNMREQIGVLQDLG